MKKRFKEFLQEKTGVKYDRTCLMSDIPKYLNLDGVDHDEASSPPEVGHVYNTYMNFVNKNVKKEDLYTEEDGSKGIENESHITVLYGGYIHNAEKDLQTIRRLVKPIRPIKITLGKVEKFRQDKYDVLKVSVIPNIHLTGLHSLVKNNIENDYEYNDYQPHITLCYVRSGTCEELVGNDAFEGIEITIDRLDFSMGDGTLKSVYIPYNKTIVNDLSEDGIAIIKPLKPLEEDGDGDGGGDSGTGDSDSGPSTTTPTTIANGIVPMRGFVIRRNGKPGKRFKETYKGIAFLHPNTKINDPSSQYGSGS